MECSIPLFSGNLLPMNKELVVGGILIGAAAAALFFFSSSPERGKREAAVIPVPQTVEKQNPSALEKSVDKSGTVSSGKQNDAAKGGETIARDRESDSSEEMPAVVTIDQDLNDPLVRVNDVGVSLNTVMPPGALEPGEPMAEEGYKAYLDMAVDRELVVQKAAEMGIMESEQFRNIKDRLRAELEEGDPQAKKEDIDWEVDYFAATAVVNEVYRKEGLAPRRVTEEEVNENYDTRNADYDWLREREKNRGTGEDKIERKVREQIKRDLRDSAMQEALKKQRSYLDTLREQANIEYLNKEGK